MALETSEEKVLKNGDQLLILTQSMCTLCLTVIHVVNIYMDWFPALKTFFVIWLRLPCEYRH